MHAAIVCMQNVTSRVPKAGFRLLSVSADSLVELRQEWARYANLSVKSGSLEMS